MPHTHHIEVDPSVQPVVNLPRQLPISLQSKLYEEIQRMKELNIIVPVHEPTDWVNSLGYLWDFRVFMVNDWVCILQYFRFRVTYLKNHYFTITKAARLPSFLLNF